MSHRWGAYITTVDHRLEYVEFETPGISRDAAVAQCMSMYGARSVENCNPISDDSYDDGNYSSSSSSDASGIFALCVLGGGCWLAYEAWKLGSAIVISAWQWIVGAAQWAWGLFSWIPFMSPQLLVGLVFGFFFFILILGALDD
jgi:hypothetical protein